MVQFLSINFFSWITSIFVGFFKSSRFFVSLYMSNEQIDLSLPTIPLYLLIQVIPARKEYLCVDITDRPNE